MKNVKGVIWSRLTARRVKAVAGLGPARKAGEEHGCLSPNIERPWIGIRGIGKLLGS